MNYSINEVAKRFDLSAHTLRYYDKEGLLPFISRSQSGKRIFTDLDLDWLTLICCLKDTGMQIKEIKQYSDWCVEGSTTIETRKQLLREHREAVLKQIEDLKSNLALIDTKIDFYEDPNNIPLMDKHLKAE